MLLFVSYNIYILKNDRILNLYDLFYNNTHQKAMYAPVYICFKLDIIYQVRYLSIKIQLQLYIAGACYNKYAYISKNIKISIFQPRVPVKKYNTYTRTGIKL